MKNVQTDQAVSKKQLSPKQAAFALGVSESSLKRWCDSGKLKASKTSGGHRRIAMSTLVQFIRDNGYQLANPEALGFSHGAGEHFSLVEQGEKLTEALKRGDEDAAWGVVGNLYLRGTSCAQLGDEVIAPSMAVLGGLWSHDDLYIYQERRACTIVERCCFRLRGLQTDPDGERPLAIGATLSGDEYKIPLAIGDVVLREAGYKSMLLGTNLPGATVAQAISEHRPRVAWLSVSFAPEANFLVRQVQKVAETAAQTNTCIILGGAYLTQEVREQLPYDVFGDSMGHLSRAAAAL